MTFLEPAIMSVLFGLEVIKSALVKVLLILHEIINLSNRLNMRQVIMMIQKI